jgi:hypothetical protein
MSSNKKKNSSKLDVGETRHQPKEKVLKVGAWEKMVANPLAHPPVRTPSVAPFTGAVRTFVRTLELTRASLGRDEFDIIVDPGLQSTIKLPATSVLSLPVDYTMDGGSAWRPTVDIHQGAAIMAGTMDIYSDADPTTILGVNTTAYDPSFGNFIDMNGTTTSPMRAQINGHASKYVCWLRIGGVWLENVTSVGGLLVIVPTAAFDGVAFGIIGAADYNGYSVIINPGAGASTVPSLDQLNTYDAFTTDAITVGRLSEYRVTAASLLCTYSGNMFNNGGVIAAARTRDGYYYTGSAYNSLTQLQDHSYRGALKDGAYVWWLPYDLHELDFKSPFSPVGETQMRVAGEFSDDSGSLQITLVMTMEFYSPLQIFEHEVGPPLTDEFIRAYHRMDSLPAATCNPSHEDILNVVKSAGRGVQGAAKFFAGHPELAVMLLAGI